MNGAESEAKRYDIEAVKKWLKDYRENELDIENQIERLERLKAKIYGAGSSQLSDMPKSRSVAGDRLTIMLAQKEELIEDIKDRMAERDEQKEKIESVCKKLRKADQRAVIRMRYLDGEKWMEITKMLFRSREDFEDKEEAYLRTVGNIHGRALKNIAKQLGWYQS